MYLRSLYNNVLYACIHNHCYNRLVHCGYIHCTLYNTQYTVIILYCTHLRSASIIISNVCRCTMYMTLYIIIQCM